MLYQLLREVVVRLPKSVRGIRQGLCDICTAKETMHLSSLTVLCDTCTDIGGVVSMLCVLDDLDKVERRVLCPKPDNGLQGVTIPLVCVAHIVIHCRFDVTPSMCFFVVFSAWKHLSPLRADTAAHAHLHSIIGTCQPWQPPAEAWHPKVVPARKSSTWQHFASPLIQVLQGFLPRLQHTHCNQSRDYSIEQWTLIMSS